MKTEQIKIRTNILHDIKVLTEKKTIAPQGTIKYQIKAVISPVFQNKTTIGYKNNDIRNKYPGIISFREGYFSL
ncbi:MAG: hypothetical protein E6772_09125 [Dysgonomonas sp.]|nr:hypothetical protein [Dysgonomonas sp.]